MHGAIKNIRLLRLGLLFIVSLCAINSLAQDSSFHHNIVSLPVSINNSVDTVDLIDSVPKAFTIRNIVIEGNKRTRKIIILRELSFRVGDSIYLKDIPGRFEESKNRLKNLSLFHENEINISVLKFEENFIDVRVFVTERWYILPLPHLKPVDRNLSQWLFKENAKINRVDYGIKLHWDNMTGNNDKARFYFVTGYTKQLMLSYRRPFIDKNMKWGINFDISLGKNHEINYKTVDNKQVFLKLKDDNYAKNFFKSNIEATYRPAFYTVHTFGFGYNNLLVHDSVIKLNPNFFRVPGNRIGFPEFYYKITHRNFDYNPYPTKGHAAELAILKQGLNKDVNVTQLTVKGIKYWPLTEKAFYSLGLSGIIKVPFNQPYSSLALLGYGDLNLRGYEFYVIDGVAGGVINATIAQQLTNFKIHIPGTRWLTPRLIPLKIYGKLYGNIGYAYQEPPVYNSLNNKPVFGGGIGFDVVTMMDFTLRIDFSFNQLGQKGLYLQKKSTFQ